MKQKKLNIYIAKLISTMKCPERQLIKESTYAALYAAEDRAKNLLMQLELIRKLDYIKYRLNSLKYDGSYYEIIDDDNNINLVRKLFGVSSKAEAIAMYKDLVAKRNYLVHPFTSRAWSHKDRKKPDNFKWVNKRRLSVAKLLSNELALSVGDLKARLNVEPLKQTL